MDVNAEEEMAEHERITGDKTIAAGEGDAKGDNNEDGSVVFLEVRGGKNDEREGRRSSWEMVLRNRCADPLVLLLLFVVAIAIFLSMMMIVT